MQPTKLLFCLGFVVLISGCKSFEERVIGKWDQQSKSKGILSNMAMSGGAHARFEFKGDHTFSLMTGASRNFAAQRGAPGSISNEGSTITGKWKTTAETISFTPELIDGKPVADYKKEEDAKIAEKEQQFQQTFTQITQNLTPEQKTQLSADPGKFDLKSMLAEMRTPIPVSATLTEDHVTLKLTCEGNQTLEFGRVFSE